MKKLLILFVVMVLTSAVVTAFQVTQDEITSYSCTTEGECEIASDCSGVFTGGSTDFDGAPPYPYCETCANAKGNLFVTVPFPVNVTSIDSATASIDTTENFLSGWGDTQIQWWDGVAYQQSTCNALCIADANTNEELKFQIIAGFWNFGTIEDNVNSISIDQIVVNAVETCTPDWACSTWECVEPNANETCTAVTDNNACGEAYSGDYTEFGIGAECVWCTPDWACDGYDVCQPNDEQLCNSVTDNNACAEAYTGDYSEFLPLVCDYCTPDWSCTDYEECARPMTEASCDTVIDGNTCNEAYTGNYSEFNTEACTYIRSGSTGSKALSIVEPEPIDIEPVDKFNLLEWLKEFWNTIKGRFSK